MPITSHTDPAAFLRQAQGYLERNEAAASLIFGNALRMAREGSDQPSYFALAEGPAGVEFVAMILQTRRLAIWGEGPPSAEAVELLAADLRDGGWNPAGVLGPPPLIEPWIERWQAMTGRIRRLYLHLRLYELTKVIWPPAVPGALRPAGPADLDLVAGWIEDFEREALGEADSAEARTLAERRIADGGMCLWEDGRPVTMAGSSRDTPRSSTIGLVYTPPELRRRGYAMAAVAALSQQRLDSGKECCVLFTDLTNPTSNSIYQRIGYRPVCDFDEYDLIEPAAAQG